MRNPGSRRPLAALVAVGLLVSCAPPSPSPLIAVMQAEDRRASGEGDLALLTDALRSDDVAVRRAAVRALGRLEDPVHLPALATVLREDAEPAVRAQAAWSVAQALSRGIGIDGVAALYVTLNDDQDPTVRAAAAVSLGRLRYEDAEQVGEALTALLLATRFREASREHPGTPGPEATPPVAERGDADERVILGAMRGLEALLRRQSANEPALHDAGADRLDQLLGHQGDDPLSSARIRFLSLAVLIQQQAVSHEQLNRALVDSEAEVRRLASGAVAAIADEEWRSTLTDRAASDPDPRVRLAAAQSLTRAAARAPQACRPLLRALDDPDQHVRLQAIDGLSRCPEARTALAELARPPSQPWHVAAHATLSLAQLEPSAARDAVAGLATGEPWQVRAYAARAAVRTGDLATLQTLAGDPAANVRDAALRGMARLDARAADELAIAALSADDPQLVMTAARLLEGTAATDRAAAALFDALDRISANRRETDRDPRMAILERLDEVAGASHAGRLAGYLNDYDPAVAERATALLAEWTAETAAASPSPPAATPFPTAAQLDEIAAARATLRMQGGGTIVLRLFAWDAPTTTARFVDLARSGSLDGLTFHRVVPNFVIQGGSPGANEFAGHGAYTRDELTDRSHLRGTVGISTRGRDTGDGQIFINLVDNVRLDHDYTIIGEVIEGMDVVDAILEGAVIEAVAVGGAR